MSDILSREEQAAIKYVVTSPHVAIEGGSRSRLTTVTVAVTDNLRKAGKKVLLLTSTTSARNHLISLGENALTIHSALAGDIAGGVTLTQADAVVIFQPLVFDVTRDTSTLLSLALQIHNYAQVIIAHDPEQSGDAVNSALFHMRFSTVTLNPHVSTTATNG